MRLRTGLERYRGALWTVPDAMMIGRGERGSRSLVIRMWRQRIHRVLNQRAFRGLVRTWILGGLVKQGRRIRGSSGKWMEG